MPYYFSLDSSTFMGTGNLQKSRLFKCRCSYVSRQIWHSKNIENDENDVNDVIDGNDENEEEVKKDIRIKVNTDNISDIDIQSIFNEIQIQLSDEEYTELKSKLEDARSELEDAVAEASCLLYTSPSPRDS